MARRTATGDQHLLQRSGLPLRFCVAADGALLALPADVRSSAEERGPHPTPVALLQRHRQRPDRVRRPAAHAAARPTTDVACHLSFHAPVTSFFRFQHQVPLFFPTR